MHQAYVQIVYTCECLAVAGNIVKVMIEGTHETCHHGTNKGHSDPGGNSGPEFQVANSSPCPTGVSIGMPPVQHAPYRRPW